MYNCAVCSLAPAAKLGF